ncbi:MAG: DUF3617 domain-containing protein [Bacillota bacterium]
MRKLLILALVTAVPAGAYAAAQSAALAKVAGGMWEVSGAPGAQSPVRQCVADILALAQFEHRGRSCSRSVISDKGNSTVVSYSCGPSDFGQTQIDVVTPRALRISTQGISDQLPFNYVIQAHRVGDCEKTASSSRH